MGYWLLICMASFALCAQQIVPPLIDGLPNAIATQLPLYLVSQCQPMLVHEEGETKMISAETVALRTLMACKRINKQWHAYVCEFFPEKDNQGKLNFKELKKTYAHPEQPINSYIALYQTVKDCFGITPKMVVALGLQNVKNNKLVLGKEGDEAFSFVNFLSTCLDWSIAARKHHLIRHFVNAEKYPSITTMLQQRETFDYPPLIHAIKLKDDIAVKILLDAGAYVRCVWKTSIPKDIKSNQSFRGVHTPCSIAAEEGNEAMLKLLLESEERIKKIKIDTDASD